MMRVVELRQKTGQVKNTNQDLELKRAAIAVVAALPLDPVSAMQVLDLARRLLTDFLQS